MLLQYSKYRLQIFHDQFQFLMTMAIKLSKKVTALFGTGKKLILTDR